jgi:hypothetical protein
VDPASAGAHAYTLDRHKYWAAQGDFTLHGAIGIDNVMAKSDYPHTDSTLPNTLSTIKERLKHRSDDDTYKIMQGNARRVFDWTPAAYPARSP